MELVDICIIGVYFGVFLGCMIKVLNRLDIIINLLEALK